MQLGKRVVKQLEQLIAKGPQEIEAVILADRPGGYIVGVPAEADEPGAAITLETYDRYSVALRHLEVSFDRRSAGGSTAADDLRRWAEQATRRLTYLEEPLTVLELDLEGKLAQLRSQPPHQEDNALIYWEALIWAEPAPRVKLTRYRWSPDKPERESVVYPATIATVGRMAQDLALSLVQA